MTKTNSIWEGTKTFFPIFLDRLNNIHTSGNACVIGAADGKFVIPLAKIGWKVTAIELDAVSLFGGKVELPNGSTYNLPGLQKRLTEENINNFVEIINENFISTNLLKQYKAIFTSCSWHYSLNHKVPLKDYISKMQSIVARNGIFCAEYMMPCEKKHFNIEHYPKEGVIRDYFDTNWEVIEDFYTEVFVEPAHVCNLSDHKHKMGFFMALKLS